VYHYWNTKSHVYEISSVHLYQKNVAWLSTNHTSNIIRNSQENIVFAESQSWMFTGGRVSAMAATTTSRGLANKQILIALPDSAQVVAVDKRLMDPRRPMVPHTQSQAQPSETVMFFQQEGIPPYHPVLLVNTLRVINYNLTLAGIFTIATASTDIESRTDVLCHGGLPGLNRFDKHPEDTIAGLDLFYLQRSLSASKSYDIMSDSFNEWLVIVCVAVLVIASVFTSFASSATALRNAWK